MSKRELKIRVEYNGDRLRAGKLALEQMDKAKADGWVFVKSLFSYSYIEITMERK